MPHIIERRAILALTWDNTDLIAAREQANKIAAREVSIVGVSIPPATGHESVKRYAYVLVPSEHTCPCCGQMVGASQAARNTTGDPE